MTTRVAHMFRRLRTYIWPIHRHELKKFIPMLLIYTVIVFNYSILRNAKDALLITAPSSGAAAIPFIKLWAILPMALLFTFIFTRLSNRFTRDGVFYIMMCGFLGFFFLFAFVLYPFRETLHPHGFANLLEAFLPKGVHGLITLMRNWTFTLFYVMSELWGTIIMTVFFWGFANEITTVKDAKRYYAILGVGANLATIAAGKVSIYLSENVFDFAKLFSTDRWGQSLSLLTTTVLISGIVSMFLYRYLTSNIQEMDENNNPSVSSEKAKRPTIKMGIRENFAYLMKSRYLIWIAVIVLTYNIALNMVEVVWKHQVHNFFPNGNDFNAYMGKVQIYMGTASTIVGLFICGSVMRRFGWTVSALIPPVILFVTGVLFFSFVFFKESPYLTSISMILGATPLAMSVFFGGLQNVLSRASKFTFFDATKEMAFIPLSSECKLKGKSAIDGVGSRLGKSGGAAVHQILLVIFGTISASTPYVAFILFGVILAWIIAVKALGKEFTALVESHEQLEIEETKTEEPIEGEPALAKT